MLIVILENKMKLKLARMRMDGGVEFSVLTTNAPLYNNNNNNNNNNNPINLSFRKYKFYSIKVKYTL
jgi:hypothetical protein